MGVQERFPPTLQHGKRARASECDPGKAVGIPRQDASLPQRDQGRGRSRARTLLVIFDLTDPAYCTSSSETAASALGLGLVCFGSNNVLANDRFQLQHPHT